MHTIGKDLLEHNVPTHGNVNSYVASTHGEVNSCVAPTHGNVNCYVAPTHGNVNNFTIALCIADVQACSRVRQADTTDLRQE